MREMEGAAGEAGRDGDTEDLGREKIEMWE